MLIDNLNKIAAIILSILLFGSFSLNAGTIVLIKGYLTDDVNKNPIGTKIFFLDTKGKKISCSSNSLDGSYQQVLASGETYRILFQDYILVDGENEIIIPEVKEYQEIMKNFSAKKLQEGLELLNLKVFDPNDTNLKGNAGEHFLYLKELLQINPKVHIAVSISSADSWFDAIKKKVEVPPTKKSKKKTYKNVTITTEEQLKELVDFRIDSMKAFMNRIGIRDARVTYSQDIKINRPIKSKYKKSRIENINSENVKIKISRIMNL